jgi:hypothetical protein
MLRVSALVPECNLSSEQVDALNAVDLRLYFGNHGFSDVVDGHGMAETRLEDVDYAGLEPLVAGLDAKRGDVLAREGMGHEKEWDFDRAIDVFFDWHVKGSPYITPDVEAAMRVPEAILVAGDDEKKARFLDALQRLRAFQLINPIEYVALIGGAEGVPCHYADITLREETDYWKSIDKTAARYPGIIAWYLVGASEKAKIKYRDSLTVMKLGKIAMTMSPSEESMPTLNYIGGAFHREGIEGILSTHGVNYSSNLFSPDRRWHYKVDMLRDLGSLILPMMSSSNDRYHKLWITNAMKAGGV